MATWSLNVKDIQLAQARVNVARLIQDFRMDFQVRTSDAVSVCEVSEYLWNYLPWNLSYYGNSYAVLDSFDCSPEDPNGNTVWNGSAIYHQGDRSEQITYIEFGENSYEEVRYRAFDEDGEDVAILNSAGERFEDATQEVVKRQVIRISKAYAISAVDPTIANRYRNSVNANPIRIANVAAPARGMWMMSVTPSIQIVDRLTYFWRFNMEIEVREANGTFDRKLLDQGMRFLREVTAPTTEEAAKDLVKRGGKWYAWDYEKSVDSETGESSKKDTPTLLDGNGGKLKDTTPGNEVYLTYRTKPEVDWAPLNLPRTVWETLFIG